MGKAWWLEHEVAPHTASEVKKQKVMDAGAQVASCSLSSLRPSPQDGPAHRTVPPTGWSRPQDGAAHS